MNDPIHICLISDEAYGPRLVVTLASIAASSAPDDRLFFYIVDGGISDADKRNIALLGRIRQFSCVYIETSEEKIGGFPRHRCAPCAYYRVLLPELLPHLDKLIYLDCDLIVLKSLRELWETDVSTAGIAAARDFIDYVKDEEKNFFHLARIGFDIRRHYINSGVMLMNLARMRAMGFAEKFFRARAELDGLIRFSDQDIFNHLFQNDLVLLAQGWNFQSNLPLLPEEKMNAAELDVAVIHYTTGAKPWLPDALCYFKEYYTQIEELVEKLAAT